MRKLLVAFSVAALFLLAGCVAHLTRQQCLTTNWFQVGFNDGAAGSQQQNLNSAIQDCAKFKLKVDTKAYHKGWLSGVKKYCTPTYQMGKTDGQQGKTLEGITSRQSYCQAAGVTLLTRQYKKGYLAGLVRFCTYDDGFNIGVQGHQPPNVCPRGLKARFMRGWRAGSRRFCSKPIEAFNLGKAGAPYPDACNPTYYVRFRSEYDRGVTIRNRITNLQNQVRSTNEQINILVVQFRMQSLGDGGYMLGRNHSRRARAALYQVRSLVRRRDRLNNQIFDAQAMR